jgi:hypothetical protein
MSQLMQGCWPLAIEPQYNFICVRGEWSGNEQVALWCSLVSSCSSPTASPEVCNSPDQAAYLGFKLGFHPWLCIRLVTDRHSVLWQQTLWKPESYSCLAAQTIVRLCKYAVSNVAPVSVFSWYSARVVKESQGKPWPGCLLTHQHSSSCPHKPGILYSTVWFLELHCIHATTEQTNFGNLKVWGSYKWNLFVWPPCLAVSQTCYISTILILATQSACSWIFAK